MMLSQAAKALNASVYGADVLFTAVSKDTRNIVSGDLYVAIKGEHFDGHDFVEQAKNAGAAAALVSIRQHCKLPQLCVTDTRLALGELAAYWVHQWHQNPQDTASKKLIAITGSNGKTTVKEMCRQIFTQYAGSEKVLATEGNLNNDIGMPLTALGLRNKHQYAVIEMGANHSGEINYLANIAKPDIALITNAASAHLEGFGSIENVAATKAEIFNGLLTQGVAVINADDRFAKKWLDQSEQNRHLLFSMKNKKADVLAEKLASGVYRVTTPMGDFEMSLPVPGKHNVMNALAATAIACAAGIDLKTIRSALNTFKNISGRLNLALDSHGNRIIDDSYNANPISVCAAIDVLAEQAGKKILVLGDMAELGETAAGLHAEIGVYARQTGIDVLYATGKKSKYAVEAFGKGAVYFSTQAELIEKVLDCLTGDEVVLVKGSRSAAMDKVVTGILTNNNKQVHRCF